MKKLAIIALSLIGSLAAAQADGGVLRVATVSEATSLDPITTNNVPSSIIFMQIHDSLITYDEELNLIPMLASSWQLSDDGLTYTFELRDDVTFHNGDPFTAADVVYAFESAADPALQSQWLGRFSVIEEVVAVDDHTVALTLPTPNAAFLDQITYFGIPSARAHQELGADNYAINPVGSGPFRFVSWQRNDRLVLERNDDYWLARPNLAGVEFRAIPERAVAAIELEVGGADVVMSLSADDLLRMQEHPLVTVGTTPTLSYYYLAFNTEAGPLADPLVRQAIRDAIPMDQLVDSIFQGVGAIRAYTSMSPGNLGYSQALVDAFPAFDVEAARARLAAAGYPNGFSTVLYTPTDSNRRQLAELIQAALSFMNINVEVRAIELGSMLPLTYAGEAPMWILGWTSGTDPNNYSFDMFHSDPEAWADNSTTFNTMRYSNPEVDSLLEEAQQLQDMAERLPLYHRIQEIVFVDDVPHIAGYHQTFNIGWRNNVHDIFVNPNSRIDLVTPYNNVWID